jgi:hypothetical protein
MDTVVKDHNTSRRHLTVGSASSQIIMPLGAVWVWEKRKERVREEEVEGGEKKRKKRKEKKTKEKI